MSVVIKGSLPATGVRTRGPRIWYDETGLQNLQEEYVIDASNLLAEHPRINDPHSEYEQLVCKRVEPEFLHAGRARWRALYRGLVGDFETDPLPDDVIGVESIANQEDIRSHPDFDSLLTTAGDDAIYDDLGLFAGFTGPAALRGVQSYFAPTVVFFRRRFTTSAPSGGANVGKIDNPSYTLANAQTSGSQNWLKMAFQTEQFGSIWQTYESWLRSGDNGWNTDIYG